MNKKVILGAMALAMTGMTAFAAEVPTYPGGKEAMDKFIEETLKYPEAALENGVEGIVPVSFLVTPEGAIESVKIVRMVDPDLEEEAVRIVGKMPAWIPAEKDGVAVEASTQIEIIFNLPGEE